MGFERNYLTVVPSKRKKPSLRFYTSIIQAPNNIVNENLSGNILQKTLNPWFITGFTDAEGSFMCNMIKKPKYKAGWEIQPVFQIKLHVKDFPVILGIQHSLGNIGTVDNSQSTCNFRVRKLKEIIELIKFFDKYPLITRKKGDYLLFKEIVSIIQLKEQLTTEGL